MTKDDAIRILGEEWAACRDALGLLSALERIGAIKFDGPSREELLRRASEWRHAGGLIEVTPASLSKACRLICEMALELEREK